MTRRRPLFVLVVFLAFAVMLTTPVQTARAPVTATAAAGAAAAHTVRAAAATVGPE